MYVTDYRNYRIQKFDANWQFKTQWGSEGSEDGQFIGPVFIAIDSNDNVYVGEDLYPNYHVQKFSPDGDFILRISPEAHIYDEYKDFNWESGIGIDDNDNVYIAWRPNIDKFSPDGQFLSTYATNVPRGGNLSFYQGHFIVAGWDGIAKLNQYGELIAWWSSSALGNEEGKLNRPTSIAKDSNGNIYIADFVNCHRFTPEGVFVLQWSSHVAGFQSPGVYPQDIATNSLDYIYVPIHEFYGGHHIQKRSPDGILIDRWWSTESGFDSPSGIAIDGNDNLYVVDRNNHRIVKFDAYGNYLTQWGVIGSEDGEFQYPHRVAVDSSGFVYVTDRGNKRIQKFDSSGNYILQWQYGIENDEWDWRSGIAIDENDHVYTTELMYGRIQKFTSSGEYITSFGSWGTNPGQMRLPEGITIDSNTDRVFITDTGNRRVQVFRKFNVTPGNDSYGIDLNPLISITFPEPMDSSSIDPLSFLVYDGQSNILGSVVYDETSRTAFFTPLSLLKYETT